jgi:hypothetical protein
MYNLVSFCDSARYELILPHWINKVNNICNNFKLHIIKKTDEFVSKLNINYNLYAWWDLIRMVKVIDILEQNEIVVQCDLDLIIQKDIQELIDFDYDLIFSKEIGEDKAFPQNCSSKLGFGICSGFFIAKPSSLIFLKNLFNDMINIKYNNAYSDQVAIMNRILETPHIINKENIVLNNIHYTNIIIQIDNIKICVLDFEIIRRDPIQDKDHYGLHINLDNVGGPRQFIKFFYEDFDKLPSTCNCLRSNKICIHK